MFNKMRKRRSFGFTFIELVVCLAILAVLGTVLVPMLINYIEEARMQKDDSAMEEMTNIIRVAITQDVDLYNNMYFLAQDVAEEGLYIVFSEETPGAGLVPHLMGAPLSEAAEELDVRIKAAFADAYKVESRTYEGESYTVTLQKDLDGELRLVTGEWGEKTNSAIEGGPAPAPGGGGGEPPEEPDPDPSPGGGGAPVPAPRPEPTEATCTPPTAIAPIYHTGEPQVLINRGSTADGILFYKAGSDPWGVELPTRILVGTYTVKYYVKGDVNHKNSPVGSLTVEILKGIPSPTPPGGKTILYDGEAHELITPGATNGGSMVYSLNNRSWSTSIPKASAVGTYTIYWKVNPNTNWEGNEGGSVTSVIEAHSADITGVPQPLNTVYDGTPKTLVTAGTASNGTFYYSLDATNWSTTIPQETNAGTYDVYYKVEGTGGYFGTDPAPVSVTIAKAEQNPIVEGANLTYTGSAQPLIATATDNKGPLHYKVGDNGTWSTTPPTGINAGTYKIYYYADGDSNHNPFGSESEPKETTATIGRSSAVSTSNAATVAGLTWDYDAGERTVTPNDKGWTFEYSTVSATEGFSSTLPTRTNAGTTNVYWRATHPNYDEMTGVAYLTCNKVETDFVLPVPNVVKYTTAEQYLATAGSAEFGTYYYRLGTTGTWSTLVPKIDTAGNYDIYYYIKGDENHLDRGSTTTPQGFITARIVDPIMAPRDTWYKSSQPRSSITKIVVKNTHMAGYNAEVWYADSDNLGFIKCYREGTTLYIVGTGLGYIWANPDSSYMFADSSRNASSTIMQGFTNVTSLNGLHYFKTNNVTNMTAMFDCFGANAASVAISDMGSWVTTSTVNMSRMFMYTAANSSSLTITGLAGLDLNNVTTISEMFRGAAQKTTHQNITGMSDWNTAKVNNMYQAFMDFGSNALPYSINISGWSTASVATMTNMFKGMNSLQQITLGKNFKFVGANSYLPVTNPDYIRDADGKWYHSTTNTGYTPAELASLTRTGAVTYLAAARKS